MQIRLTGIPDVCRVHNMKKQSKDILYNQKTLVIYTKEPKAGNVKTRLGRDIGTILATRWFRHAARKLMRSLGYVQKWQTVIAVSPHSAVHAKEYAPYKTVFQGYGTLGRRLRRTFEMFAKSATVIIGTDCPDITPHHIEQAFARLGTHDVVLGPAHDGGYWLIGIKANKLSFSALKNVRWSHMHTMTDTVNSFPKTYSIAYLEILRDVDTAADL